MLKSKMPAINDQEGHRVPAGLPPVVDAHVHVFPHDIFAAVWKWFDEHAWPIRYRFNTSRLIQYLLSRGIHHVVGLQYAHKPGIARELNQYMAATSREFRGHFTGMATVFPGEAHAEDLLQEAFDWSDAFAWKDSIAFAILIVILVVKPTGLLGKPVREKV